MIVEGIPDFFEHTLFDASEKANRTLGRTVKNIDSELTEEDKIRLKRFLQSFGRFGYCRIDGRHENGRFHFLEVTPDAWIDPDGQFAMAFTEKGWTYQQVIHAVLTSAAKAPQDR